MRLRVFGAGLVMAGLLAGCATVPHTGSSAKVPPWSEIRRDAPDVFDVSQSPDYAESRTHANDVRAILKNGKPKQKLSTAERHAYVSFLSDLNYLRRRRQILGSGLRLTIPSHAQVTLGMQWFCLNLDRHAADPDEYVYWRKEDPGIPYFSQLLLYADKHRSESSIIQRILWNLQQKVPYSSFPPEYQQILSDIDSSAPLKLSFSELKQDILQKAVSLASNTAIGQDVNRVTGTFHDYTDELKNILNSHSSMPMPHKGEPQVIDADPLFATSVYSGFRMSTTFFNTGSAVWHLDLSKFYLNPARPDVQREGLLPDQLAAQDISLQEEFEKLYQEAVSYFRMDADTNPRPKPGSFWTVPLRGMRNLSWPPLRMMPMRKEHTGVNSTIWLVKATRFHRMANRL